MKRKILLLVFYHLYLVAYAQASNFPIVGCFASWRGNPDSIALNYLTQVNFSFGIPSANGDIKIAHTDKLIRLVERCHEQQVKVFLDIGGWNLGEGGGNDAAFETLASRASSRKKFLSSILAHIENYKLDGINIDWEYPDSQETFLLLMKTVYPAVHSINKSVTVSAAGKGTHANGISSDVFPFMDQLNIMAYNAGTPHSTYEYAVNCLNYWTNKGCPKEKLVLGVPFYGTAPSTHYKVLMVEDPQAFSKDQIGTIHYNGISTIQKKTLLAQANAGGILIWELSMDTHDQYSLLKAIHDALQEI